MSSRANIRASAGTESRRSVAAFSAIWFQWPGGVKVTPGRSAQNRAKAVWSAVRTVLVVPPTAITSWYAAVYSALSRAGGGPGRNCDGLAMANGVTNAKFRPTGGPNPGGVGDHIPGRVAGGAS